MEEPKNIKKAQTGIEVNADTLDLAAMDTKPYPKLSNRRLAEITRTIAIIGNDMTNQRTEIAKLLGEVSRDNLYKQDGFRSVADYAEKAFDMKPALAYQLAEVGRRFLLDEPESETVKKLAAALPLSTLSEIASFSDKAIEEAVEAGDLSDKTTQKQARELAAAAKPVKPRVLKDYTADLIVVNINGGEVLAEHIERIAKEAVLAHVESKYHFANSVTAKTGDVLFVLSDTGDFCKVTFSAFVEEKPKKGKKSKEPSLLDMLKNASPEELATLKAFMEGK